MLDRRNFHRGAVGGIPTEAEASNAQGFEQSEQRLVGRAEEVSSLLIGQHFLHLETQAAKLGRYGGARGFWIERDGNGDCAHAGADKRQTAPMVKVNNHSLGRRVRFMATFVLSA